MTTSTASHAGDALATCRNRRRGARAMRGERSPSPRQTPKRLREVLRFANANDLSCAVGSGSKLSWGNPVSAGY